MQAPAIGTWNHQIAEQALLTLKPTVHLRRSPQIHAPDRKQCRDRSGARTMQYWHSGRPAMSILEPGCTQPGSEAYRLWYMLPAIAITPTAASMYAVSYKEKCCQSSAPAHSGCREQSALTNERGACPKPCKSSLTTAGNL